VKFGLNKKRRVAKKPPDYDVILDSGLFDETYYLAKNPDVAAAGADPLRHFIEYGWREHRDPSAAFDTSYYLQHPEVASSQLNPLVHFLTLGKEAGLPVSEADAQVAVVRGSEHFDAEYYLKSNPDVASVGEDPARHYATFGWKEGRNPSAGFDTRGYLTLHPEIADSGPNPLVHMLQGSGEVSGTTDPVATQTPAGVRQRKQIPASVLISYPLSDVFFKQLSWLDQAKPDVSIIILSYIRKDLAENLIRSIWLNTQGYKYDCGDARLQSIHWGRLQYRCGKRERRRPGLDEQ
jgi:hypothetical protein